MLAIKTCCITGHREIPAGRISQVRQKLRQQVLQAVEDGYTHYISGFADGADLLFASVIAELKKENGNLSLEAAIPYRKRLASPDAAFRKMIRECDMINIHSEKYSPPCYMKRNREMVQASQRVIAVYDGREKGGTCSTMRYAHSQQKELVIINI